jgi:hypothetical protein
LKAESVLEESCEPTESGSGSDSAHQQPDHLAFSKFFGVLRPKVPFKRVPSTLAALEVGGLTANLPRSQPNPKAFLSKIEASPTIFSWVMNNHWHTNYRPAKISVKDNGPLETNMHALDRPHGFLIDRVDDLDPLETTYQPDLSPQFVATRRVRFDQQRSRIRVPCRSPAGSQSRRISGRASP